MKDNEFMKKVAVCFLAMAVFFVAFFAYAFYNDVREAEKELSRAERQLYLLSININGGYSAEKARWIEPVLSMNQKLSIGDETRSTGDWVEEAGDCISQAYDRFFGHESWKSEFMSHNATKIYQVINSKAQIERAEQQLAIVSKNVFGGYIGGMDHILWVKPAFSVDDNVTLWGVSMTVDEWLVNAGEALWEAYQQAENSDYNESLVLASKANDIYDGLNRKANRPDVFWNANSGI